MEVEKALEAARGLYIAGSVLLGIGLPLSCCMFIVAVVIGKKYTKRRTRVVGLSLTPDRTLGPPAGMPVAGVPVGVVLGVSQGPAAGNPPQIVQAVAEYPREGGLYVAEMDVESFQRQGQVA